MKGILACLLFCFTSMAYSKTLVEGQCSDSSDCGPTECCTLGMSSYSMPQCKPLGELGDNCLMENSPKPVVLEYPNDHVIRARAVYTEMCPCRETFNCTEAQCVA